VTRSLLDEFSASAPQIAQIFTDLPQIL